MSHESRSHEYDLGFSSEIYFGIHQFGDEFFFNRMSFKRKPAYPQELSIAKNYNTEKKNQL